VVSGDGVIGVGVDLVDVERVAGLLQRKPAAEARLFTAQERAYCRRFSASAERFAARVAAKEAVGKALGIGVIGWRDIEVLGGGKPRVRLSGKTGSIARELGVDHVELSLTHTAGLAAAFAVAVGAPRRTAVEHGGPEGAAGAVRPREGDAE
jgi:holo-[acyl-carrier protein] synthase